MASSSQLLVDDIAKAVSGAVSSVLSRLKSRAEDKISDTASSSGDEFQPAPAIRVPKAKRRKAAKKDNKNKYV